MAHRLPKKVYIYKMRRGDGDVDGESGLDEPLESPYSNMSNEPATPLSVSSDMSRGDQSYYDKNSMVGSPGYVCSSKYGGCSLPNTPKSVISVDSNVSVTESDAAPSASPEMQSQVNHIESGSWKTKSTSTWEENIYISKKNEKCWPSHAGTVHCGSQVSCAVQTTESFPPWQEVEFVVKGSPGEVPSSIERRLMELERQMAEQRQLQYLGNVPIESPSSKTAEHNHPTKVIQRSCVSSNTNSVPPQSHINLSPLHARSHSDAGVRSYTNNSSRNSLHTPSVGPYGRSTSIPESPGSSSGYSTTGSADSPKDISNLQSEQHASSAPSSYHSEPPPLEPIRPLSAHDRSLSQSEVAHEQKPSMDVVSDRSGQLIGSYHEPPEGSKGSNSVTERHQSVQMVSPDTHDIQSEPAEGASQAMEPTNQQQESNTEADRGQYHDTSKSDGFSDDADSSRGLNIESTYTSYSSESYAEVKKHVDGRSNRRSGAGTKDVHPCQICGEIAAGFHCGAYICEACKKFFLRCLKSDSVRFSCNNDGKCTITKENRVRCQYCRYQRCMELGMYKPGGEEDKALDVDYSKIPCKVCGTPSSGYHFGAITCEGCKGFFRRTLREAKSLPGTCSRGGNCNLSCMTRNVCKACRWQRCIEVGMTPQGSRIGRQPNSVKRITLLQHRHLAPAKHPELRLPIKEEPPEDSNGDSYCQEPLSPCEQERDMPSAREFPEISFQGPNFPLKTSGLSPSSSCSYSNEGQKEDHYRPPPKLSRLSLCSQETNAELPRLPHSAPVDRRDMSHQPPAEIMAQIKDMTSHFSFDRTCGPRSHDQHMAPENMSSKSHGFSPGAFLESKTVMSTPGKDDRREPQSAPVTCVEISEESPVIPFPPKALSGPGPFPFSSAMHMPHNIFASPSLMNSVPAGMMGPSSSSGHEPKWHQSKPPECSFQPPRVSMPPKFRPDEMFDQMVTAVVKASEQACQVGPNDLSCAPPPKTSAETQALIDHLLKSYIDLETITKRAPEFVQLNKGMLAGTVPPFMVINHSFSLHAAKVLTFAKSLPGFKKLHLEDKISLMKQAIYSNGLLMYSRFYNLEKEQYTFFNCTLEEGRVILSAYPEFSVVENHFHHCGKIVQKLKLDTTSHTLIHASMIFAQGDMDLKDPEEAKGHYDRFLNMFLDHYIGKFGGNREELRRLVDKFIHDMLRFHFEHQRAAVMVMSKVPQSSFQQLWEEVYSR